MKNRRSYLIVVLLLFISRSSWGFLSVDLSLTTDTPQIVVILEDGKGNKVVLNTSVDLNVPPQAQGGFRIVKGDIPNSTIQEQINGTASDGSNKRLWIIEINGPESNKFSVSVLGSSNAMALFSVISSNNTKTEDNIQKSINTDILTSPGHVRRFSLSFNEDASGLVIDRIVNASDLAKEVETAFKTNLITSNDVSTSLQKKALAADYAVSVAAYEDAKKQTKNFISELNSEEWKHIQDPAMTILQEEAQYLLANVSAQQ